MKTPLPEYLRPSALEDFAGMPESYIPLSETVIYLAYHNAVREIKSNGMQPVPLHLRNAVTKMEKEWGYGKDYQYPHNFPGAWVDQEYLPKTVLARRTITVRIKKTNPVSMPGTEGIAVLCRTISF